MGSMAVERSLDAVFVWLNARDVVSRAEKKSTRIRIGSMI
jgi:hypothetical protein